MADIIQCRWYHSAAAEASKVIKDGKGTLYGLFAYNGNAAARTIQLFDSASVPADAAIPAMGFGAAITSWVQPPFPAVGIPFQNGIAICNSSTPGTKTLGAADSIFVVFFS